MNELWNAENVALTHRYLEITMQHTLRMTECNSPQDLVEEGFDLIEIQWSPAATIRIAATAIHVGFEITDIAELEHQNQLLICVDHVEQTYNVRMVQMLQQSNLTNRLSHHIASYILQYIK